MTTDFTLPLGDLFEASLATGLVILLVLIIRRPVARRFGARAAYLLWILPLLRLAMPPVPVPVTDSPDPAPSRVALVLPEGQPSPGAATVPVEFTPAAAASEERAVSTRRFDIAAMPPTTTVEIAPVRNDDAKPHLLSNAVATVRPWLAPLWAIGAALFLFALGVRHVVFMDRVRRNTLLPDENIRAEVEASHSALGVRMPVSVRMCPDQQGPYVCGIVRPLIVVPENFADAFSDEERRFVIAHELMHVRRGDLLAILLMAVVRATQWWNPLAPMAVRTFRADQESACDASVVARQPGETKRYATTLLKAAKRPAGCPRAPFTPAVTFDHGLKERIMMLNTRARLRGGTAVATIIVLAGLGATASYAFQDDAPDAPVFDDLDAVLEGADDRDAPPAPPAPPRTDDDLSGLERERARAAREARELARERGRLSDEARAEMERDRARLERERERMTAQSDRMRADAEVRRERVRAMVAERRAEAESLRAEMQDGEERRVTQTVTVIGEDGHGRTVDVRPHENGDVWVFSTDDAEVSIDSENDGMVVLTSPMAGLQDRLDRLDEFQPQVPDLPEPPEPVREIRAVKVITADGEEIELDNAEVIIPSLHEEAFEEYGRIIEKKMEAYDFEGQIEEILGEDFGERVRASADALSDLAERCEDRQARGDVPAVLTKRVNGEAQKILCFEPGRETLRSDELARFVERQRGLTDEERDRFADAQKGDRHHMRFHFSD